MRQNSVVSIHRASVSREAPEHETDDVDVMKLM